MRKIKKITSFIMAVMMAASIIGGVGLKIDSFRLRKAVLRDFILIKPQEERK